ncbi:hypothetical protein [Ectopseudomonas oleovorans]|uniref:Uncharacterized protein n=1 Tax=Ectopseudomonas oleovorans (strain CECT 5344) TaxID=1182590 RepID=W6RLW3_ECTO5|nr:hypothetical protein [Pseudomonas oleovorans]CDM42874.1 hypothetical protein BN5_4340 [Pseudomonas oleovorans CECT 5344]CDR93497.1 hypothetical protein PPSAL_4276 [Pseudomonas oleovorans]
MSRRDGLLGAVILALALLVGGSAWLRDEPPGAQVQDWQQQVQAATGESRAYLFLNGIDAPFDEQPEALGKARLQHYERWYAGRGVTDSDYSGPTVASLSLPEGRLFCRIEALGCFDSLLAQADLGSRIAPDWFALQRRYWDFLNMDDYRTLTSVSVAEPVPRLTYVYAGQQVLNLLMLQMARDGQGDVAQGGLREELRLLRQQLARADNLVLKMLLGVLVNRNLEWQVRLYRQGLIPRPSVPKPFSADERSLLKPMQREFYGIAQMYAQLPDSVSGREYLGLQLFFRLQMTINASLAPYARAVQLSQLEPEAFAAAMQEPVPGPASVGGIRNRAGNILLTVAGPDMRRYAGRLHDLEAKRRLLAVVVSLPPGPFDAEQLAKMPDARNPYHPTQLAEPDGRGQLCFDGPHEAGFNGRCMPL